MSKLADIIICNHNRYEFISPLLKSIPLDDYNVILMRGFGYPEKKFNTALNICETDKAIFMSDDIEINEEQLYKLATLQGDFVACSQIIRGTKFYGLELPLDAEFPDMYGIKLTSDPTKVHVPSGFVSRSSVKKVRDYVGLVDEKFKNTHSDVDYFLRVIESGFDIDYLDIGITHYCEQSTGRFDHINEGHAYIREKWHGERYRNVVSKIKNNTPITLI